MFYDNNVCAKVWTSGGPGGASTRLKPLPGVGSGWRWREVGLRNLEEQGEEGNSERDG